MEIWLDVIGYEHSYEVSSLGRIRNKIRNKIRKQHVDRYGYMIVSLNKFGVQNKFKVHQLVASAFVENPENKKQVDHEDTNKKNNCFLNLKWVTQIENSNNPISLIKFKSISKSKEKFGIKLICIDIQKEIIVEYGSIREASNITGISRGVIKKCCSFNLISKNLRFQFK